MKQITSFYWLETRDVIVSYYLHCTRRRKYFSGTISDFIRDDKFGIEKIIMFLNNWVKILQFLKNFFLVKYENMKKILARSLKKLLSLSD